MTLAWDDIRTIGLLVRTGSLAATGKSLGLNYTTVARRITRAETALGEVLFERLADGYQPTEAALLVAHHGAVMEQSEVALHRQLVGRSETLTGPLTITAPQLLIAHVLGPVLSDLTARHPGIDLRVLATNDVLDLSRREADLAIRISQSPGDDLKGLRLVDQDTASFASPEWAARIAEDPKGVIDWVVYQSHRELPEIVKRGYPGSRIRYRLDDMVAMVGAAESGLGVVRCPMFLGRACAGLVQVPLLPPQPYLPIWAVAHADVWPGAKVRAFRDCLVPFMRGQRATFTG